MLNHKISQSAKRFLSRTFQIYGKPTSFPKLTQSYYHNPGEEGSRLIDSTIDQVFQDAIQKYGNQTALLAYSENQYSTTFKELNDRVTRLANGLLDLGLKPGDRLAMWAPNIKEYYDVQFAAAKAGLVLVTLNPLYTTEEVDFAVNFIDVKAIICPRSILTVQNYLRHLKKLGHRAPKLQIVINDSKILNIDNADHLPSNPGQIDYRDLLKSSSNNSETDILLNAQANINSDDLAMVQFTSGTTGKPKAAALSHFNLVNNAAAIHRRACTMFDLDKNLPVCINVPMFHCFANVGGSLAGVLNGRPGLFPFFGWNPMQSIKAIEATGANSMYGTPTMYIDMFQTVDNQPELKSKLTSLKQGVVAASLAPPELVEKANREFNMQTLVAYGSTENSPLVTTCYKDDTFKNATATVGRAIDHIEVKVVDREGKTVPLGQSGELCTRGHVVFQGYLNDPEKTAEVVDSAGWFHTGDLVSMDEQGYLKITGRSKDMIIRGGENVYPSEIENILLQHEDVLDAQIVGAPDYRLGEVVAAYIRVKDVVKDSQKSDESVIADLKAHCSQHLAKFKVPIHWKIIDAYPATLSGKVKKFELRERCKQDFDLILTA